MLHFVSLNRLHAWGWACVMGLGLLGCSSPEKPKPTPLGPNIPLLTVSPAWTQKIGEVDFPLDVHAVGDAVLVASASGDVVSIDASTGAIQWKAALKTALSAGVGSDGRFAAVVSRDNVLITLDAGREVWRQPLPAVVLTAPLVIGERVFVLASDRTVFAFDAQSGQRLWIQQGNADALVLGHSGVLLAVGDTLVVGQGGRLVGLNPLSGMIRWVTPMSASRGTNEVERLVDLVAGVSRNTTQLCVRAFQSAVGCVDADKGRLQWTRPASGHTGLDGNDTLLVGTERDGKVIAWRKTDGERVWVSERLRFRDLSAPLVLGRSLVVGDASGLLHFLSVQNGEPLNRLTTDGSPILATPILVGKTLIAVTQRGGIFGFRPE